MAFTDKQRRSLAAKLKHRHVKTRSSQGANISYVEGWYVIAEANRIFGYDCWDRNTLSPRCIWSNEQAGQTAVLYTTKVRVTVRAGGEIIVREGNGTGFGRASSAEAAHEIALKAAETDATKRALATFGNPFGLALYDKDQSGVTRPSRTAAAPPAKRRAFVLLKNDGSEASFATPADFVDTAVVTIGTIESVDGLHAFWKRNRPALAALKSTVRDGAALLEAILAALKARVRLLEASRPARTPAVAANGAISDARSRLPFPKQMRVRNKEHLRYVARQPCLICGRQPTHAHHLRFAQGPRALGVKVSDEFTVPLCSVHHDAVHQTGDEQAWWGRYGIQPLKVAAKLWAITSGRSTPAAEEASDRPVPPGLGNGAKDLGGAPNEPADDPKRPPP